MTTLDRILFRLYSITRMARARATIRVWQAAALFMALMTIMYFVIGAAGGR